MKISKLILFPVVFAFASCTYKPKYQLEGLTNPLLDEWFDCFKAADSSFSAENFEATYFSEEDMADRSKDWYDSEPAYAKEYIFSPDRNYYIYMDFYTCLDCLNRDGVWVGGDPDFKVSLTDVRNKKEIDIIPTNSSNGALDAFWVNDSVFVMLGSDYDYRNEESYPYILKWNRAKPMVYYSYDGKINNFRDERFSPFFKRLKRLGIKY
ncbi:MAG: hypothetical protein LBK53_02770 [Heliobacteriaceae bacterium]|jgi:hypothetical protein|nr:hypothetical protein [Heliobacteriaceae bacterium]